MCIKTLMNIFMDVYTHIYVYIRKCKCIYVLTYIAIITCMYMNVYTSMYYVYMYIMHLVTQLGIYSANQSDIQSRVHQPHDNSEIQVLCLSATRIQWFGRAYTIFKGTGPRWSKLRHFRSDSMFKAIEPDKKLYLYDLISAEHPNLYARYGLELFNLQNANGPAYGWDQPTMFSAPQDRLIRRLQRAEDELPKIEKENHLLREAEAWYRKTFSRQLERLESKED